MNLEKFKIDHLTKEYAKRLRELADKEGLPPTTYARMLIVKGIRERAV